MTTTEMNWTTGQAASGTPESAALPHEIAELLADLACAMPSFDDPRLGYVEVQLEPGEWAALARFARTDRPKPALWDWRTRERAAYDDLFDADRTAIQTGRASRTHPIVLEVLGDVSPDREKVLVSALLDRLVADVADVPTSATPDPRLAPLARALSAYTRPDDFDAAAAAVLLGIIDAADIGAGITRVGR